MEHNWRDYSYLQYGNSRQRKCYNTLKNIELFDHLKVYNPVLVGTFPIRIDIKDSDLDIICETHDIQEFARVIRHYYGEFAGFSEQVYDGRYIANFTYSRKKIEIFAQPVSVELQDACRHMLVESRLLNLFGNKLRRQIIALKKQGFKTEPAFAKVLGLKNDPYRELLELETVSDDDMCRRFGHCI